MKKFNALAQVCVRNWPWNPIKLTLTDDVTWQCPIVSHCEYSSSNGYLTISKDGLWTIKKGFSWDGTSEVPDGKFLPFGNVPVESSFGKVPITWKASMIHDVGYGCLYDVKFPYTREEMDGFLRLLLDEAGFPFSDLYWWGVRKFGGIYKFIGSVYRKIFKK